MKIAIWSAVPIATRGLIALITGQSAHYIVWVHSSVTELPASSCAGVDALIFLSTKGMELEPLVNYNHDFGLRKTKVLLITNRTLGFAEGEKLFKQGVLAFLPLTASDIRILAALEAIDTGSLFADPEATDFCLDGIRGKPTGLCSLTTRELVVLQGIAEGYSVRQIADSVRSAVHTVDIHKHNMMIKLGVHDVVNLARYGLRNNLASVNYHKGVDSRKWAAQKGQRKKTA